MLGESSYLKILSTQSNQHDQWYYFQYGRHI